MDYENIILDFRLHGNGVSPTSFKSSEVGELLINFELALKTYIIENSTESINENEIFLSPISITNESLTIRSLPNVVRLITDGFIALTTAINTNNISTLPQKSVESLINFQKIVRAKGCIADFRSNGEVLARIDSDTEISVPESQKYQSETIIYGIIQRVGGAEPRVKIILSGNKTLYLSVNQETAINLAHKLYKEVGFRGIATRSNENNNLLDFKVKSLVDDYNPTTIDNAFGELRGIAGKYWQGIDDIEEYIFNYEIR